MKMAACDVCYIFQTKHIPSWGVGVCVSHLSSLWGINGCVCQLQKKDNHLLLFKGQREICPVVKYIAKWVIDLRMGEPSTFLSNMEQALPKCRSVYMLGKTLMRCGTHCVDLLLFFQHVPYSLCEAGAFQALAQNEGSFSNMLHYQDTGQLEKGYAVGKILKKILKRHTGLLRYVFSL